MIAAAVPVKVIDASAVPSPVANDKPVVPDRVRLPCATPSVTVSVAASTSLTVIALAVAVPNVMLTSSVPDCAPGTTLTGASLTAVTLKVMVLGLWSVSTPPLAVPPLSCTWKVKVL